MVVAELRAVALVEDEDHPRLAKRFKAWLVVAPALAVECAAKLLDGGDDHLVGRVVGEEPADEGFGVGVLLDAAFLEPVELLAGLAVEVLAIDDEQALFDVRVGLEKRGGLEAGERLAAAGGVPDEAVAKLLVDALDDALDGVDLVRPHHQELLLARDQDHVPADHLRERAFGQERVGELVEAADLGIVGRRELVDRQESLVGVEGEVAGVVVGEVIGGVAIADDEQLHEAEERAGVAVAGVVLVIDDLLDRAAGIDAQRLQFNLDDRHAIDEQQDVIPMVAAVGIDPELADDLEGVLAPVVDVDQREIQRGPVVAREAVAVAERVGGGEDVGGDEVVEQAPEFAVRQLDTVQCLELLAEVPLQSIAVPDVVAMDIF